MRLTCRLATGAFAAAWLLPAFALPGGWQADATSNGVQTYRHADGAMSGELRVFPEETSATTFANWFRRKTDARMSGIAQSHFEPAEEFRPGMVMSTGEGTDSQGRSVALLRLGCQRTGGGLVYAESSLSSDRPYVRQTVGGLVAIFVESCTSSAKERTAAMADGASPGGATAKAAERARQAPADQPYPYIKATGTGLKAGDVEAVLWEWRNEQSGMTMQVRNYFYLLLKDGSYHKGLPPVALEDFDAPASRAGEPQDWGRWKRSGAVYQLFAQDSKEAHDIQANAVRTPARRDEKLEGTWSIETAYSSLWSVSRSHREISFDRDGRFIRNSGGNVVGSMGSAAAGNAVGGAVNYDDDHSTATMGSQNAVSGTTRRRASTQPDRSGTYRLDGYTLELRYDGGRVERLSFCATGDRNHIFFDGEELRRDKPGKR